ncbi:B52 [Murid betaherpesvirus 8]|uniref:Packaging protein UL32 n=1 Tax=Rat cytomegalovirus (isolate England) TaxID=1261657 RepID=A0A0E3SWT2_RCMVE|nr:B52 [Murid betaherpesvirus 8]WPH24971.1 B52 [Murid betaherpesvirus 8]WPH25105.1 B52 [Murid betaherpesvirus 8]
MYRAWNSEITTPDFQVVNELLLHAHPSKTPEVTDTLPPSATPPDSGHGTIEEHCDIESELLRIGDENMAELRELCLALEIDSRCNLCAIVSICMRRDPDQKWLLDYSYLCHKCAAAPRTALSTLIVGTEFLYLLKLHFDNIIFDNIFKDRIITIFDFHTHFFINRCFSRCDDNPLLSENITLAHMAVTKALLTDENVVPYTKKRRLQYRLPKKKSTPDEKTALLEKYRRTVPCDFGRMLFYMWSGTNVMFNTTLTDLAIKKGKVLRGLKTRQSEIEPNVGPVYLSPIPTFRMKNATTTVCLLCEMMACSYESNMFLRKLHEKITSYSHNNLKIIDKTQLTLADILSTKANTITNQNAKNIDVSSYIIDDKPLFSSSKPGETDPFELTTFTYLILKQVGVIGLYKHFFADPLCAANIRSTDPDVLFFDVRDDYLTETKLAICSTNIYPSRVERDFWLYAHMFKAFQIIKRNYKTKTQISDFLKDFTQVLENHQFYLIDPCFIVDKYV